MRPPPAPFPVQTSTQQQQQQQAAPSSSLAAIVQNYSKAGSGGTGGLPTRDAFQQLLAEILGPEDGDGNGNGNGNGVGAGGIGGSHEEDVATNYKVLQVVTSAGLSVLFAHDGGDDDDDDPFADMRGPLLQASNSLLVIRLTIQRTPAVLFCPSPPSLPLAPAENSQPDQLFLYLWLFPRLFPLLGHKKARPIAKDLLETLEAIFLAVGSMSQHWKHLRTVAGYFRGCLNCKLFILFFFFSFSFSFCIHASVLKIPRVSTVSSCCLLRLHGGFALIGCSWIVKALSPLSKRLRRSRTPWRGSTSSSSRRPAST